MVIDTERLKNDLEEVKLEAIALGIPRAQASKLDDAIVGIMYVEEARGRRRKQNPGGHA